MSLHCPPCRLLFGWPWKSPRLEVWLQVSLLLDHTRCWVVSILSWPHFWNISPIPRANSRDQYRFSGSLWLTVRRRNPCLMLKAEMHLREWYLKIVTKFRVTFLIGRIGELIELNYLFGVGSVARSEFLSRFFAIYLFIHVFIVYRRNIQVLDSWRGISPNLQQTDSKMSNDKALQSIHSR